MIAVRDNTPADDVFGPVTVHVAMDGEHGIVPAAVFRPEELEPVRTDDTVPASEVEIVKHLTGDFHTFAAGPVDVDEPDPWQESVDER